MVKKQPRLDEARNSNAAGRVGKEVGNPAGLAACLRSSCPRRVVPRTFLLSSSTLRLTSDNKASPKLHGDSSEEAKR